MKDPLLCGWRTTAEVWSVYERASFKHSYRIAFNCVLHINSYRMLLACTEMYVRFGVRSLVHSLTHSPAYPHSPHSHSFARSFVRVHHVDAKLCNKILWSNGFCGGNVGGLVKFSGILSGKVLMISMILFSMNKLDNRV